MSTSAEVMQQLEAWGSEQFRKTFARHGIKDAMFGVSYANLGALKKKIKKDHALAVDLWQTGNHDARTFALMVADPAQADAALLESWAHDLNCYPLSDALAGFVSQTPDAVKIAENWIERDNEWVESAGWATLGNLAYHSETLPDSYFEAYLPRIERDIHTVKNRVRHEMNMLVIAIGGRNERLARIASAVAKRIGRVVVDHGKTDCKTPEMIPYIQKIIDRKNKKQKG
jgi:3-methyladenine DNA glycosylase AlkD